jgi:hypothetical protein
MQGHHMAGLATPWGIRYRLHGGTYWLPSVGVLTLHPASVAATPGCARCEIGYTAVTGCHFFVFYATVF